MVRDTADDKINFLSVRFGPMLKRWAVHLTKGRVKYPDASPGTPNWTLAAGTDEFLRAKESAGRHFESWLNGERDEDHAAGTFFNINLAEYVLEKTPGLDPGLGAKVVDGLTAPTEDDEPARLSTYVADHANACDDKGPDGWYCERTKGHKGEHWFDAPKYDTDDSATWPNVEEIRAAVRKGIETSLAYTPVALRKCSNRAAHSAHDWPDGRRASADTPIRYHCAGRTFDAAAARALDGA